ncbi:MAG TPA: hypothetical protein DEO38_04705 [Bacteroidales bacterium]|nr:hypothetical protein [Bacteroidales bacterium]
MRYNALIFDIDNTLIDLRSSLELSLVNTFDYFNYEIDDAIILNYIDIFDQIVRLHTQGNIAHGDILESTSENFLKIIDGVDVSLSDFHDAFMGYYCQCVIPVSGARRALRKLSRFFPIYCATNGNHDMQELRLQYGGLLPYVQDILSPELLNCEKPNLRFFKECCNHVGLPAGDILFIGDSLTEDIHPALSFGMATMWYNPMKQTLKRKQPTFVIDNMHKTMLLLSDWSFTQLPSSNYNKM